VTIRTGRKGGGLRVRFRHGTETPEGHNYEIVVLLLHPGSRDNHVLSSFTKQLLVRAYVDPGGIATSDPRGPEAALFVVEPGAYDLTVRCSGYRDVEEPVRIEPGRVEDRTLSLRKE